MEFNKSNSPHSDNESNICDIDEIDSTFVPCQHKHFQSLGPKYIQHLCCTNEISPYVAAGLSDNSVEVFGLSNTGLEKVTQFKEHTKKLVDCKFDNRNYTLVYTGSNDGTIKLWDLRQSKGSVLTFADSTLEDSDSVKALCSFDISGCSKLLTGGTELTEGDAYILFWDVRNNKLLGAYWESHSDDITQVKFHIDDSNKLMSGSTDGLINTYDLSQTCEDDALQECFNTDAHVDKLEWFRDGGNNKISCITSTFDLLLWESDGAEPYKTLNREDIGKLINKEASNAYIANVHQVKDSLLVLAGSNGSEEEETLRNFRISQDKVTPAYRFDESNQRVRASWLNENVNLLLTGGEKGILNVWNLTELN